MNGFSPDFARVLDALDTPHLVVTPLGRVQHRNTAASALKLPSDRMPEWTGSDEKEGLLTYLGRCSTSRRPLMDSINLRLRRGKVRFRCHGSRLGAPHDPPLVLLRLSPSGIRRCQALESTVVDLRNQLRARMRDQRRIEGLLAENESLLARLREEASERVQAERDRDLVLANIYQVNQVERLKLARDLHDQAGQHTVGLRLGLNRLRGRESPPDDGEIDRLLTQIDSIGRELHRVALQLRPTALEDCGLRAALQAHIDDWNEANVAYASLRVVGTPKDLPSDAQITVFRLVQEALTNVAKHAEATTVSVILRYGRRRIAVAIEDDGKGFDIGADPVRRLVGQGKFGIVGMRERLMLVGGEFSMETSPGNGTSMHASISTGGDGQ